MVSSALCGYNSRDACVQDVGRTTITMGDRSLHRMIPGMLAALALLLSGCGREARQAMPEEMTMLRVASVLPDAVYEPIVREFEERTGIWVLLTNDAEQERWALSADVTIRYTQNPSLMAATETAAEATAEAAAVIWPDDGEDIDTSTGSAEDLLLCEEPIVIIYNPHVLRTAPPIGWRSLLDSRWRGRIAFADATRDEIASAAMQCITDAEIAEDEVGRFYENLDGETLERPDDVILAVANEDDYIGVTTEDRALRAIAMDVDIAIVYPEEGTQCLAATVHVSEQAQEPDAALQFVQFLLSEDVHAYMAEELSVRVPERDAAIDSDDEDARGSVNNLPSLAGILEGGVIR